MRVSETPLQLKDGRQLRLRSPRVYEAESMLAYLRQLHRESARYLMRPAHGFDRVTVPEEEAVLQRMADQPRSFFLTAFEGTQIVGQMGLQADPAPVASHGGTLWIGVLRAYQGVGLGRAMLRRALDTAFEHGIWNVQLRVRCFNTGAIRLYEDLGFRRVGRLQAAARIEGEWADEFLYQRVMGPPQEL